MSHCYIGRFAPSPSGPLHLGSLMSATCSYLQAKSQQGQWLVRIEDIDTPRAISGIADQQLKQLDAFGFEWDGEVLYQSSKINHYNEIIDALIKQQKIYACECKRKDLKAQAETSITGYIYPQNCRHKNLALSAPECALRFKTEDKIISFNDLLYGKQTFNVQQLTSDWVIRRADGVIAYHLAVVVDDAEQGITEVVRGQDILPLTALHIELQQTLKLKRPDYFHHNLMTENQQKLSKQNQAEKVSNQKKTDTLNFILKALGQTTIDDCNDLSEFWQQAIKQWDNKLLSPQPIEL